MNTTTQQQAVIDSTHNAIVVAAGPGSGKTATLIERIATLIRRGISAQEITVITFTNAAADEITARLRANKVPCCRFDTNGDGNCHMHKDGIKLAYCGTLHGWVVQMLRQYGPQIGLPPNMAVIDEETAVDILDETVEEMNYTGTKKALEAELASVQSLLKPNRRLIGAPLVAASYHMKLLANGLLDFDSMLAYGLHLFESSNVLPLMITPYGFVDEYQDTSIMHGKIYAAAKFKNLCVIGDADQSIYGFLKADPHGFTNLARSHGIELHLMDKSFRSDTIIARAANRLIAHNIDRLPKTIVPVSTEIGEVIISEMQDETAQKNRLLSLIGASDQSCAVLCRTNWQVQDIADFLRANCISVRARKIKTKMPADYGAARKIVSFLCNPDNNLLAYQVLRFTHGISEAAQIRSAARIRMQTINDYLLHVECDSGIQSVPERLARSGISVESISRVEEAIAALSDKTMLGLSLALTEYAEPSEISSEPNAVTVCTIHAAKGKEWDSVFLPSWNQELFPAKAQGEKLEELRRIAFVAITRARHAVWIGHTNTHRKHAEATVPEPMNPSIFIGECDFFARSKPNG